MAYSPCLTRCRGTEECDAQDRLASDGAVAEVDFHVDVFSARGGTGIEGDAHGLYASCDGVGAEVGGAFEGGGGGVEVCGGSIGDIVREDGGVGGAGGPFAAVNI
jgi:hypothetical protein